jgi:membrane protease YdiL (CAAX protease family)
MQLQVAVMVVGALAEAAAWWVVAWGGRSVWRVMPPALITLGVVAWIVRPPVLASGVETETAALAGVLSGVLLFLATRVFVAIVSRWAWFARAVSAIYGPKENIRLLAALALTAMMAAAEELFWRGLFQARLSAGLGTATGAILTWLGYLAANLPSASLPIIAGAIVGGAVWAGLAWWSGGLLASLLCHLIWTASMVAFPPKHRAPVSA